MAGNARVGRRAAVVATPWSTLSWYEARWRSSALSRLASLRYTDPGKRDLRLDLIRGFAAFAMVVDHVGGNSSWLYWLTGGGRFFVTAAEVFVLISGLTMGLVYHGYIDKLGLRAALKKVLQRGASLYVLTVLLTFGFVAARTLITPDEPLAVAWPGVPRWAFEVLMLRRTYEFVDIPFMYTVLIFAAGPLLIALQRGHTWLVLAASWLVWAAWQLAPGRLEIPWYVADNNVFHIASWQVIFVAGLVAGFHWQALQRRISWLTAERAFVVSGAVMLLALWLLGTQQGAGGLLQPGSVLAEQLHGKADVRFGRLVVLAAFFAFTYSGLTLLWGLFERAIGWLMLPLGQHSLTAYTLHLFVMVALARLLPTWTASRSAGANALIELVGVAIVWCAIVGQPAVVRFMQGQRAPSEERAVDSARERRVHQRA